MLDWLEKYL